MATLDELVELNPLEFQQDPGLPDTNPASPEDLLPKAGNLALKGAAGAARVAPMVATGAAADVLTGGLALPWQLAAGAGAMGAYDLATGESGAQAAVDAILSLVGGGAGAAAGKYVTRPGVKWAERRGLAKAMGGAGEVAEAPAARAGARHIGMELPAQTYVHPDRFGQVVQHSGLKTAETQAMNRELQQRGNAAIQGMTAHEQPLLDTHQQVADLLKSQGDAGAAEARRIVSQYLKTEDPVVRGRLIQSAAQGNLDLREARLVSAFQQIDATGLPQAQVDARPLYAEINKVLSEVQLPSAASRLRTVGQEILTPPPAAVPEGVVARRARLDKTVSPLPEMEGQSKGTLTESVNKLNDILKGEENTTRLQRRTFTDAQGVQHTTQVSSNRVIGKPPAAPPPFISMSTAQRLRSELLSIERKLPGESSHVSGGLKRFSSTLNEEMDKAGNSLAGVDKAAYEKWRETNALYKDLKETQRDPFAKAVLESVDGNEILASIKNPAQLDQIKALLTDADGNLSSQWQELRGTLLQQGLDKAARGDGTYDAAKVSQHLFGDENRRAATNRLFTTGELKQFGTSLEKHQTAVDLANALGEDSTQLVTRIVGMDPARSETLWGSLNTHPDVQDAVRGSLMREFIDTAPGGVVDPDVVLTNIGKAKGLDPRKLEMMFPTGSAREWRPALERANEIAQAMKLSDIRLGKRIPTAGGQFLGYIKHRMVWEGAGAAATGFASHSMMSGAGAAGIILSAELTWRALTSKLATDWLKFAIVSPVPRAAARATVGLLTNLIASNSVPPGEMDSVNQQLEAAKTAAGITSDGVKLRLQKDERVVVPMGTLDDLRLNKVTPP